ncbi:MAG: hypothetical protein GX219_01815 [Tissierellia bacterium]|nr:hypothetical protein [Tissierellia bacterium]
MDKVYKIMDRLKNGTKTFILVLEAMLAYALLIMVVLSFLDVGKLIVKIVSSDAISSYTLVQQALAHCLLLVIAIELAMMLISHTPGSVIEVVLYAIAKKMLISSTSSTDLLIGAIAMAVIFAIDKYLHTKEDMGNLFTVMFKRDKREGVTEEELTEE